MSSRLIGSSSASAIFDIDQGDCFGATVPKPRFENGLADFCRFQPFKSGAASEQTTGEGSQ